MKAKQLMLGNYALYNGLTVRVRNIHDNVFLDGGDESVEVVYDDGVVVLVDPCSLEPIPITPEILEKNGFEKYGKPHFNLQQWVIKAGNRNVSIVQELTREGWCFKDIWITYVHELQNLINLCSIEKEIKL